MSSVNSTARWQMEFSLPHSVGDPILWTNTFSFEHYLILASIKGGRKVAYIIFLLLKKVGSDFESRQCYFELKASKCTFLSSCRASCMLHGYLLLIPCILKKCLAHSAIYILIEFRDAWSSESFEPQVLWILLTTPLNEMLMVTLATILSIQMDVSFPLEN